MDELPYEKLLKNKELLAGNESAMFYAYLGAIGETYKSLRETQRAEFLKHLENLVRGSPSTVMELSPERKYKQEYRVILELPISDPVGYDEFSRRVQNACDSEKIYTIGDLVQRTEGQLLKIRNFGDLSLWEVKSKLHKMGLKLGMGRRHIYERFL